MFNSKNNEYGGHNNHFLVRLLLRFMGGTFRSEYLYICWNEYANIYNRVMFRSVTFIGDYAFSCKC